MADHRSWNLLIVTGGGGGEVCTNRCVIVGSLWVICGQREG